VTNQAAIARGYISEKILAEIHERLARDLERHDAHIDRIYYCPFHEKGIVHAYRRRSNLRKPAPGMLLTAARDLGIDLATSYMVGDKQSDTIAATRAGCCPVLVLPSPDFIGWRSWRDGQPARVVPDLLSAVHWILARKAESHSPDQHVSDP
jgi:D-glycero-D-manno-heptose 1,7-bisphosphate phosphatase